MCRDKELNRELKKEEERRREKREKRREEKENIQGQLPAQQHFNAMLCEN